MTSFAELFQTKITSDAYVEASIADLIVASENASTAQYALNDKKAAALVKSIVKTGSLLIAPLMARLGEVEHIVSGRHRVWSANYICSNYGINAKGQVVLKSDVLTLEPIEPVMFIDQCEVADNATLAALILAENGSRTMSAPETASVKASGGYATEGDKFKLRFSPFLDNNLTICDSDNAPIKVTQITLGQIAGKFSTACKHIASATDEQLDTIASNLNEYLNDEDVALPTKFAQHFAPFIAEFLDSEVDLVDEDGEPVENYDKDGNLVPLTYAAHLRSIIVATPKVAKAKSASKVNAERMALMEAALTKHGISV